MPLYKSTITLKSGHALILGHKPISLTAQQITDMIEKEPQDITKLGLFDGSTPNYTTYYPDVTAEDLAPSDDEFIEPIFRMLSNVTVNPRSNPIHFPSEVLKKNMHKMVGQTILVDHEMMTGNAIGSVKSVEWQNSYTANGVKVPAGFNAVLKIDGKSNPRLARGIMMEPPSIHSNSVTVTFMWKKSHPKMADDEFWSKVGSFDDKGKLVQRIATDIDAFHETSLVPHGADPFAQQIKDGKIVNPAYAGNRYSLSDEELKAEVCSLQGQCDFGWDWKLMSSESFTSTGEEFINNQNKNQMDEILRMLETIWGLEADSLTEDSYEETIRGLQTQFTQFKELSEKAPEPVKILDLEGLEAIEAEVTSLRTFKTEVPEDYADQIVLSGVGTNAIAELKADTKRLYALTLKEGIKEDLNILALIEGANYATLKSLHAQYDVATDEQFNFECTECGSHNVTRAIAEVDEDDGSGSFKDKSVDQTVEDMTSNKVSSMKHITG